VQIHEGLRILGIRVHHASELIGCDTATEVDDIALELLASTFEESIFDDGPVFGITLVTKADVDGR
jgi:hypothetical protein